MRNEVNSEGAKIALTDIIHNVTCKNVNECKYEHRNCHRRWCHGRTPANPRRYGIFTETSHQINGCTERYLSLCEELERYGRKDEN
jgi:hypothetical protein